MSDIEVLKDTLSMLDKFEENRKADYSIWGYLYQFDLMFYDMLTDKAENDLFDDYDKLNGKVCNIIYEAEMVEDYCKEFILDNKLHIRLAQIKYNARSKSVFYKTNKDALKTLYYIYLKSLILDCEEFDFKCSLFYFNLNKDNNEIDYSEKIKLELTDIVKKEIESLKKKLKEDEDKSNYNEWVAANIDDEIIYKELGSKDLDGRIQYLFYNYSSDYNIDNFINNILIVKKVPKREDLINDIKEVLERDYNDLIDDTYSLSQFINKGDMLYSLGVNFIINEWQSKKDKSERKPINLNEVKSYIQSINSNDISMENIVENLLVKFFEEILEFIYDQIFEDESENLNEEDMIIKFEKLSYDLLKYFKKILKLKSNRYALFNTISNNRFKTIDEYLGLSVIDEYTIINQMKDLFISFCVRILKIMYWEKYINNNEIRLTDWFKIDQELLIFRKKDLKIKTILLPNAYDDRVKSICKDTVHRINRINQIVPHYSKPRVWYFKNINDNKKYSDRISYTLEEIKKPNGKKMQYRLNIANIPDPKDRNNIVGCNDDYFYIECMDCLKMNEISNYEYIEYIFSERCVNCELKKNR